jgi:hypothetical protein
VAARGAAVTVDGVVQPAPAIPLIDDARRHDVGIVPAAVAEQNRSE